MRNIKFVLIDSLKTYDQHKNDARKVKAETTYVHTWKPPCY